MFAIHSNHSAYFVGPEQPIKLINTSNYHLDYLTVPMNSTGSWGMMAILLRRSSRPICAILISSMIMEPPVSSTSLNRAAPREDFPAGTQTRYCMKKLVHALKRSFKNKLLLPGERKGSLLPDPVRPTMPMVSPGRMVKDSFFRTRGRLSR